MLFFYRDRDDSEQKAQMQWLTISKLPSSAAGRTAAVNAGLAATMPRIAGTLENFPSFATAASKREGATR